MRKLLDNIFKIFEFRILLEQAKQLIGSYLGQIGILSLQPVSLINGDVIIKREVSIHVDTEHHSEVIAAEIAELERNPELAPARMDAYFDHYLRNSGAEIAALISGINRGLVIEATTNATVWGKAYGKALLENKGATPYHATGSLISKMEAREQIETLNMVEPRRQSEYHGDYIDPNVIEFFYKIATIFDKTAMETVLGAAREKK